MLCRNRKCLCRHFIRMIKGKSMASRKPKPAAKAAAKTESSASSAVSKPAPEATPVAATTPVAAAATTPAAAVAAPAPTPKTAINPAPARPVKPAAPSIEHAVDTKARLDSYYANFVRLLRSPEELILDFGLNTQPFGTQTTPIKIEKRLVLNFYTAKRLLAALTDSVQRYERAFGSLETNVHKRVAAQESTKS